MNMSNNAEEPSPCQDSAPNSALTNANNAASTIARPADKRSIPGQLELPLRHPAAYVSLFAPAGRRRMWWFTFICAHCSNGHFGRVRDAESVEGLRRAGCGRLVWLVVAKTYRGQQSEVAA